MSRIVSLAAVVLAVAVPPVPAQSSNPTDMTIDAATRRQVIDGVLAWIDCDLEVIHEAGDLSLGGRRWTGGAALSGRHGRADGDDEADCGQGGESQG